jgi:hypothetical protein
MDDGSYQTLVQSTNAGVQVGQRVLVGNSLVQRY